jgi:hypothetical protein
MVKSFTAPANRAEEDNKDSEIAGSDGNDGEVGESTGVWWHRNYTR